MREKQNTIVEPTKGEVPLCLFVTKDECEKHSTKIGVEIINIIREVIG
jgi:propionyl-CoA synthetase